ncbi:MAG: Asp/Glu/hydantoin racemase [Proteobacteria bacterium]|nr:Asp/Glu/hydantoin racemase [Pseudomonadota bacterium]
MRILVVNPNTDEGMTRALAGRARAVCPAEAEIEAATVPFGPTLLSRRRDVAVAGAAVLALLAERAGTMAAAVIGAFADPGLEAAREVLGVPVTGLCEASVLTACQLGARIGLMLGSRPMVPAVEERLRACGVSERVCGIETPAPGSRPGSPDELVAAFGALARGLVERAGAEVIVLGGGRLIGFAPRFAEALPVPVLDSVDCAVLQAHALARLQPRKATVGSFGSPPPARSKGLSGGLARLFADGT